jgi:TonB-dependent receptor
MSTGKQFAGLLLLSTALTMPGIALAQDDQAPVEDMAQTEPDAPAEEETYEEPDISVPGGAIVVTGRRIRDVTRSSTQVISVLSSEEIARTGEGDISGALGRVTGLSVQGQGFVYVRGLGDRYSLALLNGLPLPSPQPLSRVVPLDIFPTNVVSSSLVQKTYSANFPGEFGGGVINLTTRAVPEESFLKLSAGITVDNETTGLDGFAYYGTGKDWTGFSGSRRNTPAALQSFLDSGARLSDLGVDQQAIAKSLTDPNLILAQKIPNLPPNWSASLTAGTATDVGGDGRLGIVATLGYKSKWRNRDVTKQSAVNANLDLDSDFRDFVTDNRILLNAMLGFGLEIGQHKIRWTNLYIRDTVKQTSLEIGTDFQNDFTKSRQSNGWFERQLLDSQLVGEFRFGDLGVDLRGGWAQTKRDAPFEYEFEYVRTNNPNDRYGDLFVNVLDRQRGNARVVFSELKEDLWYGGIDLSYPLMDWLSATVGYAYTDTSRYSERREFLYNANTDFPDVIGALRPDYLLSDDVIDMYGIGLIETTQADPAFDAGLEIHAAYAQARLEPTTGLTVDLGVRYEDATQTVNPVEVFATPTNSGSATLLANDYFLPAATITWEAASGLQARVSASKTIARPQFRELIFQTYYDPETNRQFNGNPFLIDSELTNYEGRLEYYFGRGNRASIAGFYKDIKNPIEAYSSFSDNEQVTSFANAPKAELYGAELELQYNYDLFDMGGWLENKRAVLVANYTYTKSKIRVGANDLTRVFPRGEQAATNFFRDGVPLTGQSDHLVNLQFGIENQDRLEQFTVLLTYASDRVTSRGTSSLPDIVESPGLQLDFVAREGVKFYGKDIELKLEARNITGRGHREFQSNGTNRIDINSYDVGTTFSASASIEF